MDSSITSDTAMAAAAEDSRQAETRWLEWRARGRRLDTRERRRWQFAGSALVTALVVAIGRVSGLL